MANAQTILPREKAMLAAWGKAGDILARALNASIANDANLGRAALIAGGTPAAKGTTNVHADVFGDAVGPVVVTTGLTNPDVPRNLRLTFGADWDGGDVTVVGTDQFNLAVSETFTATPSSTVVGTKVFKTVTSFSYDGDGVGTHATNVVSLGTGDLIGITTKPVAGSPVLLTVDGVGEAVTYNGTVYAFTPTTVPNGSHVYVLTANV